MDVIHAKNIMIRDSTGWLCAPWSHAGRCAVLDAACSPAALEALDEEPSLGIEASLLVPVAEVEFVLASRVFPSLVPLLLLFEPSALFDDASAGLSNVNDTG